MPQLYNPVTDAFTYYTPTEPQQITLENPFKGNITLDGFSGVGKDGTLIASANTPQAQEFDLSFLDRMAETHQDQTVIPSDNPGFEGGALIDNEKFAYNYLVKKGLPKGTAAGIVGNLYHEDLANPTRTVKDSHGTTAYGIAGFNSNGEYPALMAWADKNKIKGKPNFQQQLDFIVDVVKDRPRLNLLLNKKITPTEASFIWGAEFEKFAGDDGKGYRNRNDSHHKRRAARANKIYKSYG